MNPYMHYLSYLTFPADKNTLVSQANNEHLPEQFVHELEKVPNQEYLSAEEFLNTYALYK